MNKRLFTGVLFLISLCFTVGKSYACPRLEAVISPPETKWAHQGYAIGFNGSGSVGSIVQCTWSLQPEGEVISYRTRRYWHDILIAKFNTLGEHTVTLTVQDSGGQTRQDTCLVNVVAVDLVPGSHTQPYPNAYVAINNNDDDSDGVQDKNQTGTVDGEEDLSEIQLSVAPIDLPGEVELRVGGYDYWKVKIWSHSDKQNLIIPNDDPGYEVYYKKWLPQDLPETLHVEGLCSTGTYAAAVALMLCYVPPEGGDVYPIDRVDFTVLEVDMDMDGVKDDDNEYPGVTEEITPGGFIPLNDLVKITLRKVSPTNLTGNVTLDVTAGGSKIQIWENDTKTGSPLSLPETYATPSDLPDYLWVEGVETSSTARDIELVLQYLTFDDRIKVTVVKVDVNAGLSEPAELDPGKYINVNWDDDDEDGWQPNDNPPEGVYTGDRSDPEINGGDSDFRSFTVSISPWDIPIYFPNSKVSITFPSNVKVWQTNTKKTVLGDSSELTSGAQFKVENLPKQLYLEGISGSAEFRDVELKATWLPRDFSDMVNVTVFEVDLTGLFDFGPQQDPNENDKRHSTFKNSSDKNGKISWDDANADGIKVDNDPNCEYFSNCMECQGTVKPSGVTNQVQFNIKRLKWYRIWEKLQGGSWQLVKDWTPWTNDDLWDGDEDLTPSGTNHIYSLDGPGAIYNTRSVTDYFTCIGDFREWVIVNIDSTWYQCSNYYKWHSKMYAKPKDANYLTRDSMSLQQLGEGWIAVPNSP